MIKFCRTEQKHDSRKMYKILKAIGVRDIKKEVRREEFFTPNEYILHFKQVSKERFERSMEEIYELKIKIPNIEDKEYLNRAELMSRAE